MLQSQRLALFSNYTDESLTYEDIASPWRNYATSIWGQQLDETTDLFATALEMMGVDVEASVPPRTVIDSRSVLPVLQERAFDPRLFVYAELFGNHSCYHHGQTIRNTQGFKLIRFTTHPAEFYNLTLDPFEIANLLLGELDRVQQANFNELISKIEGLTGEI
ncbi:MAG: hypothetical protein IH988_08220 [Planctomycetes bacterium]|nr:hypothetical protein [Planctomycetota bacterium]